MSVLCGRQYRWIVSLVSASVCILGEKTTEYDLYSVWLSI